MTDFLRIFCIAFILSALLAKTAQAETLILKNGDRLSGQIIERHSDYILLNTVYGELRIDTAQVQYIDADIHIPNETTAVTPRLTRTITQPPAINPVAEPTAETTAPPETPATQTAASPSRPSIWSGRANLGASLQTGNTDKENLNADAMVRARWNDQHRSEVKFDIAREKTDDDLSIDRQRFNALHDYFYTEKWFVNSGLTLSRNRIDEIDLRTIFNLGIGHQVYESEDINLKYVFGPSYIRTNYDNAPNEDDIAAKWSLDYDQRFFNNLFQFFHAHSLTTPFDEFNAYILNTQTGVRAPLRAGLIATAEIQFDRDNDPAPGVEKNNTLYNLKLGYEW